MKHFYFYDSNSGIFTGGQTYYGPVEYLNLNTPAGHIPYEGEIDYLSQRFDFSLNIVVDYQPESPPATDLENWMWDTQNRRWVSTPTKRGLLEKARITYEGAAQSLLDVTAQSWGYDSLISASSYALSSIPQFKAEAVTLIGWRDALWAAAYKLQSAISEGTTVLPTTAAEFLALLPSAPARPAA